MKFTFNTVLYLYIRERVSSIRNITSWSGKVVGTIFVRWNKQEEAKARQAICHIPDEKRKPVQKKTLSLPCWVKDQIKRQIPHQCVEEKSEDWAAGQEST